MKQNNMLTHWEQVRRDLIATVDMFHDDELTFAPFEGSWPVGKIMLHIADCEDNWLHGVVRQEFEPWVEYHLADYPSKEHIKQKLAQVHGKTNRYFENPEQSDLEKDYAIPDGPAFTLDWILWHVLEHEIHHRGELSLALGLLGREGLDV